MAEADSAETYRRQVCIPLAHTHGPEGVADCALDMLAVIRVMKRKLTVPVPDTVMPPPTATDEQTNSSTFHQGGV